MTQQPPLSSSWERKLECLPADNCSYSSSRLLLSPKLLFLSPLSTWHFSRVSVSWESGSSFSDLVVRNIRYVHIGNDFILGEIFFWENTYKNFSGIENRTGKLSSMLWMWTLLITGGKNNAEKDVYPFINRIPTKTECWLPPRKFFLNLSIIGKWWLKNFAANDPQPPSKNRVNLHNKDSHWVKNCKIVHNKWQFFEQGGWDIDKKRQ